MTDLNIEIEPSHQQIAARLGLAAVDGDADRVDVALAELADAGIAAVLAVLAVQTRNLAAAMVLLHQGVEPARAVFQRTILDAKLVGDG